MMGFQMFLYLFEFTAQFAQSVSLLQSSGTGPLALFGQSTGELFVLSPLVL